MGRRPCYSYSRLGHGIPEAYGGRGRRAGQASEGKNDGTINVVSAKKKRNTAGEKGEGL